VSVAGKLAAVAGASVAIAAAAVIGLAKLGKSVAHRVPAVKRQPRHPRSRGTRRN
jgi:hypothetical protein